jgi:hypothetical protein
MFSRSIIDESRSKIDASMVTFQLVASFTIDIYNHDIFIAQDTGKRVIARTILRLKHLLNDYIEIKKLFPCLCVCVCVCVCVCHTRLL